ncbi:MAG: hypothetical protein GEU73_01445 [Chloroflexi bacterium]|nr:hypothetical protein [Chloroflexota bacterium]
MRLRLPLQRTRQRVLRVQVASLAGSSVRVSVRYEVCEGHGACAEACPAVFRMMGPKPVLLTIRPNESLRAEVERAAHDCPTNAIALADE